jgi:ribosomal protein RSM22 (predicted rRNA methylase)
VTLSLPSSLTAAADGYRERYAPRLKELADGVDRLSKMFTGRARRPRGYLSDPLLRRAYAHYFTPLNSLKVRWVLEELKRYDPGFFGAPRDALDYGCGCGAGLLGLAQAGAAGTLRLFDIVREVREDIDFYFNAMRPPLSLEWVRTVRDEDRFDLILLSHVVSELGDPRPVLSLVDHLRSPGYLVVIEPADQANTLALQKLRDRLAAAGQTIAAPCLHAAPCPMLRDDPKMWCCMEEPIERPRFVSEIDRRLGFEKSSVKFSYLVVTRGGRTLGDAAGEGTWRLVGDIHRTKGRATGVFCGRSTELRAPVLLNRDRADATRPFLRARRGEVLRIDIEENRVRSAQNV